MVMWYKKKVQVILGLIKRENSIQEIQQLEQENRENWVSFLPFFTPSSSIKLLNQAII